MILCLKINRREVAPHVGAWIETYATLAQQERTQSLPMWERGLKHSTLVELHKVLKSLPMWERGLKPLSQVVEAARALSLPMWERGLKHANLFTVISYVVAPHVGAWIETDLALFSIVRTLGRSPCGSVD